MTGTAGAASGSVIGLKTLPRSSISYVQLLTRLPSKARLFHFGLVATRSSSHQGKMQATYCDLVFDSHHVGIIFSIGKIMFKGMDEHVVNTVSWAFWKVVKEELQSLQQPAWALDMDAWAWGWWLPLHSSGELASLAMNWQKTATTGAGAHHVLPLQTPFSISDTFIECMYWP